MQYHSALDLGFTNENITQTIVTIAQINIKAIQ
jgi:hypothetical protein